MDRRGTQCERGNARGTSPGSAESREGLVVVRGWGRGRRRRRVRDEEEHEEVKAVAAAAAAGREIDGGHGCPKEGEWTLPLEKTPSSLVQIGGSRRSPRAGRENNMTDTYDVTGPDSFRLEWGP